MAIAFAREKLNFYSEEWGKIFEVAWEIEIDCDELIEAMRNELTAEYMWVCCFSGGETDCE